MAPVIPACILTQSLFDQSVEENMELFEMSRESAVQCTVEQYEAMGADLSYIELSGGEEGGKSRMEKLNEDFLEDLNELDKCVGTDGKFVLHDAGEVVERLRRVRLRCEYGESDPTEKKEDIVKDRKEERNNKGTAIFFSLMHAHSGHYTLLSLLTAGLDDQNCDSKYVALREASALCLLSLLSSSSKDDNEKPWSDVLRPLLANGKMSLLLSMSFDFQIQHGSPASLSTKTESPASHLTMLRLATLSLRGNERNRREFYSTGGGGRAALDALFASTRRAEDVAFATDVCRFVAAICRVDDDRSTDVFSGMDHARDLVRLKAVTHLRSIAEKAPAAAFVAARALACREDTISSLISEGFLSLTTEAVLSSEGDHSIKEPALGLLRNLAGSDSVANDLGKDRAMIDCIVRTVADDPSIIMAAHGMGLLAALTLRNASRGDSILWAGGGRAIVRCMRRHACSRSVQRSGCLTTRSLIGQGSVERRAAVKEELIELGIDELLKSSGKLAPDEAYAALREMRLHDNVKLITLNEDGKVKSTTVEMFGDGSASNFRPIFEESADIEVRIRSNEKNIEECIRC